jgi:hypothetical protein
MTAASAKKLIIVSCCNKVLLRWLLAMLLGSKAHPTPQAEPGPKQACSFCHEFDMHASQLGPRVQVLGSTMGAGLLVVVVVLLGSKSQFTPQAEPGPKQAFSLRHELLMHASQRGPRVQVLGSETVSALAMPVLETANCKFW